MVEKRYFHVHPREEGGCSGRVVADPGLFLCSTLLEIPRGGCAATDSLLMCTEKKGSPLDFGNWEGVSTRFQTYVATIRNGENFGRYTMETLGGGAGDGGVLFEVVAAVLAALLDVLFEGFDGVVVARIKGVGRTG